MERRAIVKDRGLRRGERECYGSGEKKERKLKGEETRE
jgi:hypothetical protein